MSIRTVSTLLALLALTACATGIPRQDGETELARYQPYLGEPVSQFNMYSRWDGWTRVDNEHVLIRTNVNDAYLLKLAPVCMELPFVNTIAIRSRFPNTVASGFDSIIAGRDTCRILEIRPVDYKRMRADLKAEKEALKQAEESEATKPRG